MTHSKPIVFITGHSGLLGSFLSTALADEFIIHPLIRTNTTANNPSWNYRQSLKLLKIKAPFA